MMNVKLEDLEPVTAMCGVFVNMDEKLDLGKIDAAVNMYAAINSILDAGSGVEPKSKDEHRLARLSFKLEMVLRNIMITDKTVPLLKDRELVAYLAEKTYMLTGYCPLTEFVRSVVSVYKPFLAGRIKIYNKK